MMVSSYKLELSSIEPWLWEERWANHSLPVISVQCDIAWRKRTLRRLYHLSDCTWITDCWLHHQELMKLPYPNTEHTTVRCLEYRVSEFEESPFTNDGTKIKIIARPLLQWPSRARLTTRLRLSWCFGRSYLDQPVVCKSRCLAMYLSARIQSFLGGMCPTQKVL